VQKNNWVGWQKFSSLGFTGSYIKFKVLTTTGGKHVGMNEVRFASSKATVYTEGARIDNAERGPINISTYAEAVRLANADPAVVGFWQRTSGKYSLLKAGSRSWAAGVPNGTVKQVWKKSTR